MVLFSVDQYDKNIFWQGKAKAFAGIPEKEAGQIRKRQNAVKELSKKIDFCQSLQCEGMMAQNASKILTSYLTFVRTHQTFS